MDINTKTLCSMIRAGSKENRAALRCLGEPPIAPSLAFSVLRREADALVRVIYLLSVRDINARRRLIDSTLRGSPWTVRAAKGGLRNMTDRDLVSLADKLKGWTKSAYKFGCGLIHLSEFHNRFAVSPWDKLKYAEKQDILSYLRGCHGGAAKANRELAELGRCAPGVFKEISDNLERFLDILEQDGTLDDIDDRPGASAEASPPRL